MTALLAWWRRHFWQHHWVKDNNPYRRRCTVCGRREESFCATMETWHSAWWEATDEGDKTKHYRKKP